VSHSFSSACMTYRHRHHDRNSPPRLSSHPTPGRLHFIRESTFFLSPPFSPLPPERKISHNKFIHRIHFTHITPRTLNSNEIPLCLPPRGREKKRRKARRSEIKVNYRALIIFDVANCCDESGCTESHSCLFFFFSSCSDRRFASRMLSLLIFIISHVERCIYDTHRRRGADHWLGIMP
jgi:hypothetical protein